VSVQRIAEIRIEMLKIRDALASSTTASVPAGAGVVTGWVVTGRVFTGCNGATAGRAYGDPGAP